MKPRNREKKREIQEYQAHCAPKPQRKTSNIPSMVANYFTERNFLRIGGTTIDSMTPEINISQYVREVNKSNTNGYGIISYSGRLK